MREIPHRTYAALQPLPRKGWQAEVGSPPETRWNGQQLLIHEQPVSFVVNRSTDFYWHSEDFSALRRAYEAGQVYVAPNPFTYATRSDKRLLEWLSQSEWDDELGIRLAERQILSAHVPETYVVRAENLEMLAQMRKDLTVRRTALARRWMFRATPSSVWRRSLRR